VKRADLAVALKQSLYDLFPCAPLATLQLPRLVVFVHEARRAANIGFVNLDRSRAAHWRQFAGSALQVVPGSAADHAGLKGGTERAYIGNVPIMLGGDLLVAIDGQAVEDQQDLSHVMQNHRSGDTVTVTVIRGKKRMDIKVVLGEAKGVA
jgi:S1-C subfamily serine protease